MLHRIEAELVGHPAFGDTQCVFDRLRAIVLLFLEGASRNKPFILALHQELRDGPHRQAAAVLADPVVLSGLQGALRRDAKPPLDEAEELFAATLRHLRDGPSGPPTAVGCLLQARPRCAPHDIALWDPALPQSLFKRCFESNYHEFISNHHLPERVRLQRPRPAFVEAVERGSDLLAALLPQLAASALAHLRLIGVFSAEDSYHTGHFSHLSIASTMFLHRVYLRNPWLVADALLHEALHCKLADLTLIRDIWQEGSDADDAPRIRPLWRRHQQGPEAAWPVARAFVAFHVHVHMALFFMRVERLEARLAGEFGAPPESFREGLRTALYRAGYLRQALDEIGQPFGPEGRLMFAWLSGMLQQLSDST